MNLDAETFGALWYQQPGTWATAAGVGMSISLSCTGSEEADRKRNERAHTDPNIVRADNRRYQRALRARLRVARRPDTRACVLCRGSMQGKRKDARFCSLKCQNAGRSAGLRTTQHATARAA